MRYSPKSVIIEQHGANWIVQVSEAGITQRFACHSRQLAEHFASLFECVSEVLLAAA